MHDCNYYCRGGLHADIYYLSPDATEGKIAQLLGFFRGLRVEHAEPAKEAGPKPDDGDVIYGAPAKATQPWLVFWKKDSHNGTR